MATFKVRASKLKAACKKKIEELDNLFEIYTEDRIKSIMEHGSFWFFKRVPKNRVEAVIELEESFGYHCRECRYKDDIYQVKRLIKACEKVPASQMVELTDKELVFIFCKEEANNDCN